MSIPSAMAAVDVENFNVLDFAEQITQLTSASYVMVNVTNPSRGNYFTGPHPILAEALNLSKPAFPTRDLLGEVLDAIAKTNKKALVYFAAEGFHTAGVKEPRAAWNRHIEPLGITHEVATGKLIVGYYAQKYGTRIDGWWFDGSGALETEDRLLWRKLVRDGNPDAIVAFNRMAGPPFRSTAQCDYFGGHPAPRTNHSFWDKANLPMIEAVEAGPWMDLAGKPVAGHEEGALGHVFMGMQRRWNKGGCAFPPDQAVSWTTRVASAGGMYTWHVPREESRMQEGQFELLLKVNEAVELARTEVKCE